MCFIVFQEVSSWSRHGVDSYPNLSLFVHECVELQLSFLPETTESQSDRSSTGDDLDENENQSVIRLQKGPMNNNNNDDGDIDHNYKNRAD